MGNRKSGNFPHGIQTFYKGGMVDSKTAQPHAIELDGTRTTSDAAESKYDFAVG